MLIVDAANVMGSRPDGWWRDRAGAAERLIARVAAALEADRIPGGSVVVVLEGRARPADPPLRRGLEIVRADGSGDDAIVAVAADRLTGDPPAGDGDGGVVVVTADRGLQQRVRALGAQVWSPRRLLELLGDPAR